MARYQKRHYRMRCKLARNEEIFGATRLVRVPVF